MTAWIVLKDLMKQLQTKEKFYRILNDEHISEEDYKHAKVVRNTFNLKT